MICEEILGRRGGTLENVTIIAPHDPQKSLFMNSVQIWGQEGAILFRFHFSLLNRSIEYCLPYHLTPSTTEVSNRTIGPVVSPPSYWPPGPRFKSHGLPFLFFFNQFPSPRRPRRIPSGRVAQWLTHQAHIPKVPGSHPMRFLFSFFFHPHSKVDSGGCRSYTTTNNHQRNTSMRGNH